MGSNAGPAMPDQLVAKSLQPENAGFIADRLRAGDVAGVLLGEGFDPKDETFVLVEKRDDGATVAHGTVTVSAGVPFTDPSQLTSLSEKVGESAVKKAREEGEPVSFHSVYAVDVWSEPRTVGAAIKKAEVSSIVTPDAEHLADRLRAREPVGVLSGDGDLRGRWGSVFLQVFKRDGDRYPYKTLGRVDIASAPVVFMDGAEAVKKLGDQIGPKQRTEFKAAAGPVYYYGLSADGDALTFDDDGSELGGAGFTLSLMPSTDIEPEKVDKAEWSTEYVNDLPDSAFLFVESGEKDDDGKTKPRSLRHLPVKDADGKADEPHIRAALSRLNQVKTADGKTIDAATQKKLRAKALSLLASIKKSVLPRVLTADAVAEGWMPDEGSGLPSSLESAIPEMLRYWEHPVEVQKQLRDMLVETRWLTDENVIDHNGELVRTVEVMKRHVYVGNGADLDPLDMLATSTVDSGKALETDNGDRESKSDATSERFTFTPITKADDRGDGSEWGYVLGEVLTANDGEDGNRLDPDAHNDVISTEQLVKTAREYARDFRRFGKMHKGAPVGESEIRFCDSFVVPKGWKLSTDKGYTIDKPTWLLGAEVKKTSALWKDIKAGRINAWSIDGRGQRVPEQVK